MNVHKRKAKVFHETNNYPHYVIKQILKQVRISERVLDNAGRDQNPHLFNHSTESGHPVLDINNYKIIDKG